MHSCALALTQFPCPANYWGFSVRLPELTHAIHRLKFSWVRKSVSCLILQLLLCVGGDAGHIFLCSNSFPLNDTHLLYITWSSSVTVILDMGLCPFYGTTYTGNEKNRNKGKRGNFKGINAPKPQGTLDTNEALGKNPHVSDLLTLMACLVHLRLSEKLVLL